ncbi:hypothetical protein CEP54_008866 [Fusarium duplospermum]|uniref:Uncharacterized protein n=1 Tax=Fusarium duplospermum TaxID=1325734 RepID=A0A428PTJ4_9HYPO|nr:hypothetical protein CEP54_008866 [Fusarium duplospermum]
MSIRLVFLSLLHFCWAQIPNSDVGQYPSGVVTLIAASWMFFRNSTSTLYGMLPQYWLVPGLQTAKKQFRDGFGHVQCCQKNCYHGDSTDIINKAKELRQKFAKMNINLEDISKQIVASGSWSFSTLVHASDDDVKRGSELFLTSQTKKGTEQQWLSEFGQWEADVNSVTKRFWVPDDISTISDLLNHRVVIKTFDAISVRVGSRRRTMNLKSVSCLLAHAVAAAAARDAKRCIVFEAMLISIWAGVAFIDDQDPTTNTSAKQWANPVLVSASTPKLQAVTPPAGSRLAYEPIETHGLWVYMVCITGARVTISTATTLGSSGSLWLAIFAGLYLTNPSAAGSFGREKDDARADCGLISGEGFYMNFARETMPTHVNLHDRVESMSTALSLVFSIVVRLLKQRLRSLLGYGDWVSSAPWQLVPGILLSIWASAIYLAELIANLDKKAFERMDPVFIGYKAFILVSSVACVCLGVASITTAYSGSPSSTSLRWVTYGVAEFHSWHVCIYHFQIDKVDGPDMWFASTSTLAATWGAVLLAVASDLGESLL